MRAPARWTALVALLLASATPARALAGDGTLDLGLTGGTSTWQGDPTAGTLLRVGYRIDDWLGFHGMGRLGYASVDERALVLVGVGAQAWTTFGESQPFVRLTLVHAHEEPVDAIPGDVFGALFGVGDGIRHRAGVEPAVGLDYRLWRDGPLDVVATAEASFQVFPDDRGPTLYVLGGLGLGIRHDL